MAEDTDVLEITDEQAELISTIVNTAIIELLELVFDDLYEQGYSEDVLDDMATAIEHIIEDSQMHIYVGGEPSTLH